MKLLGFHNPHVACKLRNVVWHVPKCQKIHHAERLPDVNSRWSYSGLMCCPQSEEVNVPSLLCSLCSQLCTLHCHFWFRVKDVFSMRDAQHHLVEDWLHRIHLLLWTVQQHKPVWFERQHVLKLIPLVWAAFFQIMFNQTSTSNTIEVILLYVWRGFVAEEINFTCMKLLDSDCTFCHFACLDLRVEGSRLWRKLQALVFHRGRDLGRALVVKR